MSKINWNTISHENLLILGYPFDSNSTQNDLLQCENNKALQDIINFILLRVDPKVHEDFSNLLRNTNDRKGRIIYLRQLFNWSIEVIRESFNDFKCNSALFVSPRAPQIYEFLGKLTTSVLKMEMKKIQKNSSSTLRPRVILSDLQFNDQCFAHNLSRANKDFVRETKTYLEHLNTLVTRKEVVEKELKCKEETRYELLKEIDNLKREINSKSNVKMNEINEDSIGLYDADISQRLHETNCRFDKLTTTLEQLTVLCSTVQERFAKKPDDVKIDIPSSTNIESTSLIDNDKISLARMFSKLKTELLFNKNDYDEFVIRREENRVKDGIQLVESSISQNLMDITQTKQNLLQIQNKIVQHAVTDNSNCLVNFMSLPSVNTFIASYGDGNDDELGSPIRGDLRVPSADLRMLEDSTKLETTYNAEARSHEINLQKLSTETINKFLNRAPELDSTILSDSDFLYQSDPNDSFFSSPPTACKLDDRVVRAMARMKSLEKLESLSDDEF